MKTWYAVIIVAGIGLSICSVGEAFFIDAEYSVDKGTHISDSYNRTDNSTTQTLNSNSHNRYNSDNRYTNDIRSNYNQRYDSSQTNSHNRDQRSWSDSRSFDSHAITDSYKGNSYDQSAGKRISSHDVDGLVRNSVMGSFDQVVQGTSFQGGVAGDANTIEAATTFNQTFGDVQVAK